MEKALVEGKSVLLSEEVCLLLLDVSGSMGRMFGTEGTYLDALKNATIGFVNRKASDIARGSEDKIGVITFGHWQSPDVRLTHDPFYANYGACINKLLSITSGGTTPMKEAIQMAIEVSERFTEGLLRLIVVSDGEPDDCSGVLETALVAYEDYGLLIDTIAIGDIGDRGVRFMENLAKTAGGEFTTVSNPKALNAKFTALAEERALLIGKGIFVLPEHADSLRDGKS